MPRTTPVSRSARLLAAVFLAGLLAACSDPARPVTAAPSNAQPEAASAAVFAVVYHCPDGTVFTTFPRGENAQVDFANRNLPAAASETGSVECEGTDAKDVWEAAKLRGVALRAVGTEPGWLLEIAPGRQIVFARDYGAQRTAAAAPAAQVDAATHTTRYLAKTDAGDLRVEVKDGACSDGMSDTAYTASATVSLGSTTWKGCARTL